MRRPEPEKIGTEISPLRCDLDTSQCLSTRVDALGRGWPVQKRDARNIGRGDPEPVFTRAAWSRSMQDYQPYEDPSEKGMK